jgi:hypothetical protein
VLGVYLFVRILLILITIVAVVLVLIIFILKLWLLEIVKLLVLQGLASKPVNGTGNELLLDVLAKLVIKFKALFNLG